LPSVATSITFLLLRTPNPRKSGAEMRIFWEKLVDRLIDVCEFCTQFLEIQDRWVEPNALQG
jgi:hypothetical protein